MSTLLRALPAPDPPGALPAGPRLGIGEVRAFDQTMFDDAGQAALAARAAGAFTGLDGSTALRILAFARPFSADPAIRALQDLRRACGPAEAWRQSGLAGLQTFLELLVRAADLRSTQYFLLAWTRGAQPPGAVFRAAEDGFLTAVTPVADLPAGFADCREEWDRLAPREPGNPYLAVYGAYEFVGHWTPTTVHRLLRMPFPLALAIDLETLGPDKADFQLQSAYNGLYTQLNQQGKFGGKDSKAETAFADVQRTMAAVEAGERLHKVTLAVLIGAPSARRLADDGAYLTATLTPYVRLRRLRGQQAEALKWFTTTRGRNTERVKLGITRVSVVADLAICSLKQPRSAASTQQMSAMWH